VIFDIVEYIMMEWTMPNESQMCRRVLILKKKEKSVAGQFAAVKYRSETYCLDSMTKQGRFRGREVLGSSCCCKGVNTVERH
jgi:hypothetical protein